MMIYELYTDDWNDNKNIIPISQQFFKIDDPKTVVNVILSANKHEIPITFELDEYIEINDLISDTDKILIKIFTDSSDILIKFALYTETNELAEFYRENYGFDRTLN